MPKFIPHFDRRHFSQERLIAIFALVNLLLVLFNLSYLYARDFYLQAMPGIVKLYDPVKGIEPHSETENYLEQVEGLESQIITTGLESPQVEDRLAQLRQSSLQIINDNPFAVANKSSILEKIKNEIRQRTGEQSARDALTTFWSSTYLENAGWQQELAFWDRQIRPIVQTNYYRDIGRFGNFVDYFWLLDLPFVVVFALDLFARITSLKLRNRQLNWLEVILRRWYDLFLLLPFWRWLRVIPVSIRLDRVDLLNLQPIRAEAQRDFVINFAAELTEMVGIQLIDQMQQSIRRGDAFRKLLRPETIESDVPINGNDEVQAIATRLIDVSVYDVLPQVQPDIEHLLHHTINNTLKQLPVYRQLQNLPGLDRLPTQLSENLAKSLSNLAYNNLTNVLEDPKAAEIATRLSHNFRDALERELFQEHNISEIKTRLIDLLEEIKINYIKSIEEIGIEKLIDEAEQLHRRIETYANVN